MESEALLEAAAANLAAWHDSSVRALGFASTSGSWWWSAPTPGPWIYFTAIALRHPRSGWERRAARSELARHLDDPAGSFEAVCDSFGDLDLEQAGLARRANGLWYARQPDDYRPEDDRPDARSDDDRPDGQRRPDWLVVTEVDDPADLAAFERMMCAAFLAPPPIAPFDIHAPAILADPAMHVLIARTDESDEVVAGAMAYVAAGVVGMYGVGTVPGHRRAGYATALTRAGLAIAPDLPAILQPSTEAAALYRRIGFVEVGRFSHWG